MSLFSLIPPVFVKDSDGDNRNGANYLLWIVMYARREKSDAGVLAQEWWEFNRLAAALVLLILAGAGIGYLVGGGLGAFLGGMAGLILRTVAKAKPIVRWLNTRSHAVEVEASLLVYGGDREALLAREAVSLTYGYGGLFDSEAEAAAAMRPHLTAGRRWAEKRLAKLRRYEEARA